MKTAYFGNPWIGMFAKTNNDITILPIDSMKKFSDISLRLKTEVVKLSIADSNLLGIYIALNSKGIILPNVVRAEEISLLKKTGLNVHVSEEKNNAHGNNIAVNDKGGIISPHVDRKEALAIEDALGVELVPMTIAGYSTVGSACIATNDGFALHYKASDDEMESVKKALRVYGNRATVNTGVGFVSYGVIANIKGYVVGENTTAFESGRIEEALGLIEVK